MAVPAVDFGFKIQDEDLIMTSGNKDGFPKPWEIISPAATVRNMLNRRGVEWQGNA